MVRNPSANTGMLMFIIGFVYYVVQQHKTEDMANNCTRIIAAQHVRNGEVTNVLRILFSNFLYLSCHLFLLQSLGL